MRAILLGVLGCLVLVGCGDGGPLAELEERVEKEGTVSFLSWDGELKGEDLDAVLRFSAESRVELEKRGLGVETFSGTYAENEEGKMELELEGLEKGWPLMELWCDGNSLYLTRADGVTAFDEEVPETEGFWPFRAESVVE